MKILLIAFELGKTSSGIATDRIAEELSKKHELTALTASSKPTRRPFQVVEVSSFPLSPARLFALLGNLLRRDLNYMFWESRATRRGLAMIQHSRPDVIYARGSPSCAFTVGLRLSQRSGIPLAIHFADPIPATPDWQPQQAVRTKMLETVVPALRHATLATFVNRQMLEYQEKTTSDKIAHKAHILQNPIPDYAPDVAEKRHPFTFTFLGSFFGSRKPDSLLDGFSLLLSRRDDVTLRIYGPREGVLAALDARPHLQKKVELCGWTSDPKTALAESSCLIDLDADVPDAVYTSNKLMEYLAVDRLIVAITPQRSAARELITRLQRSCFVTDHSPPHIADAMERALNTRYTAEIFEERLALRKSFSLGSVCAALEERLASVSK
jgi:glycosyltransferase involved in cell wall biosynthesis